MGDKVGRLFFQGFLGPVQGFDGQGGLVDTRNFLFFTELVHQQVISQCAYGLAKNGLHAPQSLLENIETQQQSVVNSFIDGTGVEEIPDENALGLLADTIDAANALFYAHWVPGQIVIDQKA